MSFEQINDDVRICFDWKEGMRLFRRHHQGVGTLSFTE